MFYANFVVEKNETNITHSTEVLTVLSMSKNLLLFVHFVTYL
jgi:hypothetical protein